VWSSPDLSLATEQFGGTILFHMTFTITATEEQVTVGFCSLGGRQRGRGPNLVASDLGFSVAPPTPVSWSALETYST
jgi:hypothetical protein